jgi:hypothetical protein
VWERGSNADDEAHANALGKRIDGNIPDGLAHGQYLGWNDAIVRHPGRFI